MARYQAPGNARAHGIGGATRLSNGGPMWLHQSPSLSRWDEKSLTLSLLYRLSILEGDFRAKPSKVGRLELRFYLGKHQFNKLKQIREIGENELESLALSS